MNITGDHWPINPLEYDRVQKPSNKHPAIKAQPKRPSKADSGTLHNEEALRQVAEKLIDSGDVTGRTDGSVRKSRVNEARKNTKAGAYNNREVLGQIVDRLLDQWKI